MGQLPTEMVSGIVVVVCSNSRKVQGGFELIVQRKCLVKLIIFSIPGAAVIDIV